jgi:hypothetical protein
MGERRVVLEAPLQGHHLGIGTRYAAKRANQAELAQNAICHETKPCAAAGLQIALSLQRHVLERGSRCEAHGDEVHLAEGHKHEVSRIFGQIERTLQQ